MRRGSLSMGMMAGTLLLARPGRAQSVDRNRLLTDLSQSFPGGAFTATAGDWVVYRLGPEPYRFLRVAILAQAPTAHGKGYWMEIDTGPVPLGGALSMKLLTAGDPRVGLNIERAYFRLAGGAVQELDQSVLDQVRRGTPPGAGPNQSMVPNVPAQDYATRVTHAGSFRAVKVDNGAGTVFWLSPDAPVFHLVSISLPDRDMEIFAYGDKALDTMGEPAAKVTMKTEVARPSLDGGAP